MDHLNQPENLSAASGAQTADVGQDLFALTDEQILELEPDASSEAADAAGQHADAAAAQAGSTVTTPHAVVAEPATAAVTVGATGAIAAEPPRWLADMMADPRSGGEARDFWNGVNQARQDAAAYREVFAGPGEARAAAERARVLDEIDGAYFAGDAAARSKLAATMMREDPAAFREMVFEGLRALEELEKGGGQRAGESRLARALGASAPARMEASANNPIGKNGDADPTAKAGDQASAEHTAHLAAYATFEKSANEDLERSVAAAIGRTLEQALSANGRGDNAALKSRLVSAIRQDVEKALQGDRQLGEQVAQLLSGKRLNNETRAQVVRLIGERAEQLVPGAAKRVLSDWTQTSLTAHREKTGRGVAAAARPEVATAAAGNGAGGGDGQNKPARGPSAATPGRSVDYRKVSDEQILAM